MPQCETVEDVRREFLNELKGVKKAGDGWVARCPVPGHGQERGDINPSLSVVEGEDKLLVKCHAGYETEDVCKAIYLELKDLYPNNTVLSTWPAPNAG